jgi:sugar phosphate isomerase/epimerase
MRIGIHTDNYRLESRGLDYCLDSVRRIGAKLVELNVMQGFDLFQGHGFVPNVSMCEDPWEIKEKLEARELSVSCLDAHYPLWSYRCVEHLRQAVLFASALGVDAVATTDSDQLPRDMSEEEAFAAMKLFLGEVLKFADRHKVAVCIEPHGRLTNHPEKLMRLVNCHRSDFLRINFDTANTFIAGWEPQEFLRQGIDKVHHCHVKDVSESLAAAVRGEETGIVSSEVALGEGVNAGNILECLKLLKGAGFAGVLCIECHGEQRSEASYRWLSKQVSAVMDGRPGPKQEVLSNT